MGNNTIHLSDVFFTLVTTSYRLRLHQIRTFVSPYSIFNATINSHIQTILQRLVYREIIKSLEIGSHSWRNHYFIVPLSLAPCERSETSLTTSTTEHAAASSRPTFLQLFACTRPTQLQGYNAWMTDTRLVLPWWRWKVWISFHPDELLNSK